jgi:hypothetical protein
MGKVPLYCLARGPDTARVRTGHLRVVHLGWSTFLAESGPLSEVLFFFQTFPTFDTPLSSEYGTRKTATARFWPWRSAKSHRGMSSGATAARGSSGEVF